MVEIKMAAIFNRRPQNQDPHHYNGNSLDSRVFTLNADAIFYTTRLFFTLSSAVGKIETLWAVKSTKHYITEGVAE